MDRLATVRRRLRDQRLAGDPFATPHEVVSWLVAVQAQDWPECRWSIAQRLAPGATAEDVDAALASGAIVRTHVLRPTWHAVAAEDARWLLELTAARVHRAAARSYRAHELHDDLLRRAHEVLRAALQDGEPRTKAELADALAAAGIPAPAQRVGHLAMHAELEGLITSGPRRGARHTHVLLDDLLRGVRERRPADPLAELARRYVTSHGPATARDFAWWSGVTLTDARAALERVRPALETEHDEAGRAWWSAPDPGAPAAGRRRRGGALLVGMFDESTIAFQDLRGVSTGGAPRAGLLERPILLDGVTVGTWRRTLAPDAVTVEATLLGDLGPRGIRALEAETARLGRVLGLQARLVTTAAVAPGFSR
jgi:hypothetical protein